jgi:D-alanyl-D-alanine carboxypeptidase/D-alanyl-D-alanine-endopeptidase (penicillin-binding protein 4)
MAKFPQQIPPKVMFNHLNSLIHPVNFLNVVKLGLIGSLLTFLPSCNRVEAETPSPQVSVSGSIISQEPLPSPSPSPLLVALNPPNPDNGKPIADYLAKVKALAPEQPHGIWIQTGQDLLGNHQGTVPLSAASLTKIATSLVALKTLGVDHQYITEIGMVGTFANGVVNGDLIIKGGGDPMLVWEEAIALGSLLNKMGIKRVTGNLVVNGDFFMNFEPELVRSGEFFREAINVDTWSRDAEIAYGNLPNPIPKPSLIIGGEVKVAPTLPTNTQILVRHYSLPLTELVKKMNQYSNNPMAEMIANSVGGAKVIAEQATEMIGVPAIEMQLENGSGLSDKNRMSPRAAVGLFLALEKLLAANNLSIADAITVVGQDPGVLDIRPLPPASILKSGTLNTVSALGGVLPTEKYGLVWFAILNSGADLETLRAEQENFLQTLLTDWQLAKTPFPALTSSASRKGKTSRSEVLKTLQ